jgi:uncharacterized protein (DUF697 family)
MVVQAEATDVSVENSQDQAAQIIASSVKWAAAASIIPVPYLYLVGLAAVQLTMVKDITRAYGQEPKTEITRGLISTLLGTLAPSAVSGALVGSSLKFIPFSGSLLGSVSLAAFGSAATYAVGKAFVRHFENGGTLDNFSVEAIKEDLKQDFSKAKKDSTEK